jgi:hypothetical protein
MCHAACSKQHTASSVQQAAYSKQRAALVACVIFKYLHATKEHSACGPMLKHAVRSIAYST